MGMHVVGGPTSAPCMLSMPLFVLRSTLEALAGRCTSGDFRLRLRKWLLELDYYYLSVCNLQGCWE